MADRIGWHCTACNRYSQVPKAESPPAECPNCGADRSALNRIDHDHDATVSYAPGDVVVCELLGFDLAYVIGRVIETADDRVRVDALDGSGEYTVKPEQIIHVRPHSSSTEV